MERENQERRGFVAITFKYKYSQFTKEITTFPHLIFTA